MLIHTSGLRKNVLLKRGWGSKIRISWSTASDGAMDGNIIIIKDLVTQKWNVALCPLMKTLKGMQLQNPRKSPDRLPIFKIINCTTYSEEVKIGVLSCAAIHEPDEYVCCALLSCSFIWIYYIVYDSLVYKKRIT